THRIPALKPGYHPATRIPCCGNRAAVARPREDPPPKGREILLADQVLDDKGYALADADTHGRQAVAPLPAGQLVDQGGGDTRSAGSQRVAQGDGATVDIDPLLGQTELADAGQRLRSEGRVELGQVDIVQVDAGPLQRLAAGRDGADP